MISLIEDGQRTKAACWAYFSGDEEPAISILMNSDSESISFGYYRLLTNQTRNIA